MRVTDGHDGRHPGAGANPSWKETMQAEAIESGPRRSMNTRSLRRLLLALLGVHVGLFLALSLAALSLLTASLPDRTPRFTDRMSRYLHSGQLRADVHTLAAICQFVATVDFDAPSLAVFRSSSLLTNIANPRPPENAVAGSPEPSNSI